MRLLSGVSTLEAKGRERSSPITKDVFVEIIAMYLL
jgi:hypothetical protein